MKNISKLCLVFLLITSFGCQKKFKPFFEKAKSNYASKNYVNAVDNLTISLLHWKESDGKDQKAEAYQLLGQSYQQLRNIEKAEEAYEQAVQLSDQTFESAYALGLLHLTKGQSTSAIKLFRKALTIKKDDPLALLGLANSLYSARQYMEAYATYQKVLDVSPGVRDAMDSIAALKIRLKQNQTVLPIKKKSKKTRRN